MITVLSPENLQVQLQLCAEPGAASRVDPAGDHGKSGGVEFSVLLKMWRKNSQDEIPPAIP
jgi:hypothetical protein